MRGRGVGATLLAALALAPAMTSTAVAAMPHVVAPGETLWSISAANNLTTRTVAVFNGLPEEAQLLAGQTIQVPTVGEGATALASAGYSVGAAPAPSATATGFDPSAIPPAPGMGHIPSPWGELHLAPEAADAWNAMRAESLRVYGIDLVPDGPLSAHRTYEQQAYLYDLYLSGQGAPANLPGTSSHETGYAVDVDTPEMRWVIDQIGAKYCWGKIHAPGEWWHLDYLC
jgi:LAS superfamily LD-carboxypeptidase LdcB